MPRPDSLPVRWAAPYIDGNVCRSFSTLVDQTIETIQANQRTMRSAELAPPTAEPRAPACLNCGTALTGPFCAECGQRDIPPYPSARELVVDAFSEVSGWDGRFATTLRALIRRPGLLTREFLEGRRARYISPVRLYLVSSLVYFLLAAGSPDVRLDDGKTIFLGLRVTSPVQTGAPSRPQQVGSAASQAMESQQPLPPAVRDSLLAEIDQAPAFMRPFLRRSITDPAGFKNSIFEGMPRMLFALLPLFALIVAIFYRGRKYPEHLYFAVHLHAFAFLALGLIELAKYTGIAVLTVSIAVVAMLIIPVYATVAFRTTYGGSVAVTVAKEAGIGVMYAATTMVGFMAMVYFVSLAS